METFRKTGDTIRKLRKNTSEMLHKIFLRVFQYRKHELDIARFGAQGQSASSLTLFLKFCYILKRCTSSDSGIENEVESGRADQQKRSFSPPFQSL